MALGDEVIGIARSNSTIKIDSADGESRYCFVRVKSYSQNEIGNILASKRVDRVFHLAAMSFPGQDSFFVQDAIRTNHLITLNVLTAVARYRPKAIVVMANTVKVFEGDNSKNKICEQSRFSPMSPYAFGKLNDKLACDYFRTIHNCRIINLYLANHESEYRDSRFLFGRMVEIAARFLNNRAGRSPAIRFNDLTAESDWGCAREFVKAFVQLSTEAHDSDILIATGSTQTVAHLVIALFDVLGLKLEDHVDLTTSEIDFLNTLDNWKPKKVFSNEICFDNLGWTPRLSGVDVLKRIVELKFG